MACSSIPAASWWRPRTGARRRCDALAERHGIPRITTDWRELAADPDVDAVVIGTPNALHAPQAIACLEAGKHVLVEKPMARTLAEAEAMNAAAAASGAAADGGALLALPRRRARAARRGSRAASWARS